MEKITPIAVGLLFVVLGAVLGCVIIAAGIPSVMSYVCYKQEQLHQ